MIIIAEILAGIVFVTYLCKKHIMPELFRQYGFIFMFFSREHEPIHVHVRGHNGDAKFNWDGEGFEMEYVNRSSECVNNFSLTTPKVSTILREGQCAQYQGQRSQAY